MATRDDPYGAFQFAVTVSSAQGTHVAGGFADVTGLAVETEVESFRVGGVNDAEITLPGPAKWSSRLTLKRGLGDAETLWKWYCATLTGAIKREDVTIELRKPSGETALSWTFRDACPIKWTGPELHSTTSAVSFETIELVHRGIVLKTS